VLALFQYEVLYAALNVLVLLISKYELRFELSVLVHLLWRASQRLINAVIVLVHETSHLSLAEMIELRVV
jgi:hypothetical protein